MNSRHLTPHPPEAPARGKRPTLASRLRRAMLALALLPAITACGYGYVAVGCEDVYDDPAIIVDFVAAESGRAIPVIASGIAYNDRGDVLDFYPYEYADGSYVYSLEADAWVGNWTVEIDAARFVGEPALRYIYDNVRVRSDACGPIPEVITVPVE